LDNLPKSVLFACTENSVRSPMAEGIMRSFHGRSILIESVGVFAGHRDLFMIETMKEIDIDMSDHQSRIFGSVADDTFDYVIALSTHAQNTAVELTRYVECEVMLWNTFDPTVVEGSRDVRLNAYREVRDFLIRRILEVFPVPNERVF